MKHGAIYARYSSRNQREESIEDQIAVCRAHAGMNNIAVLDEHIYADAAESGAKRNRRGLRDLMEAAENSEFELVLVDDLSRLYRDNVELLLQLGRLSFRGVRVISVADGLDSGHEDDILGIQLRSIINENYLRDLKKKTLRGQVAQARRGFSAGARPYGYTSVAEGEIRIRRGVPTPEGYKTVIQPAEAAVILTIFQQYADGDGLTKIAQRLNDDEVASRRRGGWSPPTLGRILDNERYVGHWVWNRFGYRREPQTNKRRKFEKPKSEWVIHDYQDLRIIPDELWQRVRERREASRRQFPAKVRRRGFDESQTGSREDLSPTHLLSGAMKCGECGGSFVLVAGTRGGYYGCLAQKSHRCTNRVRVHRKLVERRVVAAVQDALQDTVRVKEILKRVEAETERLAAGSRDELKLKEQALKKCQSDLAGFVDFVARGKGSDTIADAIQRTEGTIRDLEEEVRWLRAAHERMFEPPPEAWIEDRLRSIGTVLERNVSQAGLALRDYLGKIEMRPVKPEVGRPYLVARMSLGLLELLADPPRVKSEEDEEGDPGDATDRFGPRPRVLGRSPTCVGRFDTRDACSNALRLRGRP